MRLRRPVTIAAAVAVVLSSSGVAFVAAPASAAVAPVPLVLSLVGDGAAPLVVGPTAVTLDTINSDGSASSVPDVALPVAASGANQPFTLSGTSSAIGQLALAGDKKSLAIAGYAATPGQAIGDPKDSLSTVAQRIVASIDPVGTVDTSTMLTGAFSADHPRSVATQDGQSFYVSGNGAGKTPAAGVILAQRGSTAVPVGISATPANARNVAIANGQLYTTASGGTDRGVWTVGTGLPTASGTTSTRFVTAATGTPTSMVALDRDSTPGIDTVYYVNETLGLFKSSLINGTWTAEGSYPGDFQAVTGRVVDGVTELYLVKATTAANTVIATTDTAGGATIAVSTPNTIATAPANTAYRGIAFAPTAWAPVAPVAPVSKTTLALGKTAASTVLGGTVQTTATIGTDGDDDLAGFTLEATASSKPAVVAAADVVITGEGATRTLTVTPKAVGITVITVTATNPDDESSATASFTIGASATTPELETTNYHYGSSDASTAIALDSDYMIVADDEGNSTRLYERYSDGAAITTYSFPEFGSSEIDLEASARIGNTIYWMGSHSNNKSSEYKKARSVVFTTTVSGEGAGTHLTYGGQYTGLRTDLIAWDAANGNRLGLAAACSLEGGAHPDQTNGCNIEGFEFAPDGTTGLLGLRSPRVDGKAVIVPVANFASLIGGTTSASFGDPILVDLGGRTIREIRGNGNGDYFITAGVPDDVTTGAGWALYRWNGLASSAPYLVTLLPNTTGDAGQETGSFESIVEVPSQVRVGSSLQLLTDNGTTVFYADGIAGKDISPSALQKFRSNVVTVGAGELTAGTLTIGGDPVVGSTLTVSPGDWAPSDVVFSYAWLRGSTEVGSAATYAPTASDIGAALTVEVTASRVGFASKTVSATTPRVQGKLMQAGTPSISGARTIGSTLTAKTGTWLPADADFAYSWTRDGEQVGTGATYRLVSADAGHTITVKVTAFADGYETASATSAGSAISKLLTTTPTPKISGTAKKGKTLKATIGTWAPGTVTKSYRWYRDGSAISGATTTKYKVRSADKGHRLTLKVTGTKSGYFTVVKTSAGKTAK